MYTNLPKVTSAPGIFKNDLNLAYQIKIKLCRSGIFSYDQLSNIPTGEMFNVGVIETGIDRVINLIPKVNMTPQAAFNAIFQTLQNYLQSKAQQIAMIFADFPSVTFSVPSTVSIS